MAQAKSERIEMKTNGTNGNGNGSRPMRSKNLANGNGAIQAKKKAPNRKALTAKGKKRKHAGGAKTKLTPEMMKRVHQCLTAGLTHKRTCDAVGITYSTFYDWKQNKTEFSELVKEAESVSEQEMLDRIRDASLDSRHWAAAAWWLERRHPSRYGKHVVVHDEKEKPTPEQQEAKYREIFQLGPRAKVEGRN